MVGDAPAEGLHNLTPNLLPSENQFVQEPNRGVEFSNLHESGQFVTLQEGATAQSAGSLLEKHATSDISLRHVLSDTISGILMEDAMVMPCGHSFGISGLHRVNETSSCLTCGAPVPPNSMIPNYALRDAVIAYKQEGLRKKRELHVQAETDGKRLKRACADPEVSRSRGVQFPYVENDRVLIKGNKRTPERFVGREAVITAQCLNGWYLVKTLDNGESVRLQYRSLQKLGDKEITTEISHGTMTDTTRNGDGLKGPLISTYCISLPVDSEEGFSPKSIKIFETTTFHSGLTKGPHSESLSRSKQTSQGHQPGNQLRASGASMGSWQSGRTCSNSSQESQGDQVHGKCTKEAAIMLDSADEDQRATKKIAAIGATGGLIEGSTLQSKSSIREHNTIHCRVWEDNGCEEFFSDRNSLGRSRGRQPRARPKHLSSHKTLSSRPELQDTDPYKKVYASGLRRRANNGDSCGLLATKQSAFASLNLDFNHCSALPVGEHQEADVKTSGESSSHESATSFCNMLKKRMLDLETEIPQSFMKNNWKRDQAVWLDMLKRSCTLKDVANRLDELRRALLLEKAGDMSDNEWSKELEAAVEREAVESVDHLWRKFYEDISGLRDRQPLSSIKTEFLELKNRFPQLCLGGLSLVGIIAATTMAAAEAYAVGEQDIETLLTIPMKLVQEHNIQDLRAVIDAIEREKDHLSAIVVQLRSGSSTHGTSNVEDADNMLIENPKQAPASPRFLAVGSEKPLMSEFTEETTLITNDARCSGYDKEPFVPAHEKEKHVVCMEESGGEETDMSNSL